MIGSWARRLAAALLLCVSPLTGAEGQPVGASPETGEELRVWLITIGPGNAVWERYGHNALRVLNLRTGRDVSYNWGIFDFRQAGFIPRFLQGRMLYMMASFTTQTMIDAYARADRETVAQELELTAEQKLRLKTLADRNALAENREYVYQYFRDNCSTRVRDLLDVVLGGRLRDEFEPVPSGTTYRFHTRRLMQVDPLVYTGMDLLLGTPTDQSLSVWDEMFLPLTLRDEIRAVRVTDALGVERPLVLSEEVISPSTRLPEPARPPGWLLWYAVIGVLLGAVLASARNARVRARPLLRYAVLVLSTGWLFVGGVLGTVLVLLLFTDHTFAWWNENLFLFHPMLLGQAILLPFSQSDGRWRSTARVMAVATLGLAFAGAIWQVAPVSVQDNAIFLALALPAHLGLALSLRGPAPAVGKASA